MKVLNTSHQIVDVIYNSEKSMMTINTPDNTFIFKWNLDNPFDYGGRQ